MKITVLGATGKVGQLVVAEALHAGHSVVACYRKTHPFGAVDNLSFCKANVYDAASIANAIKGSDAVISTLGSWGTPNKDVLSTAMKAVIPAMHAQNIPRIVTLTGSDAWLEGETRPIINTLFHQLLQKVAGKIVADGEEHLQLLKNSQLSWTTLRSPVMTDFGKDTYVLMPKAPFITATIKRRAVACALVDLVADDSYYGQAPHIYRA